MPIPPRPSPRHYLVTDFGEVTKEYPYYGIDAVAEDQTEGEREEGEVAFHASVPLNDGLEYPTDKNGEPENVHGVDGGAEEADGVQPEVVLRPRDQHREDADEAPRHVKEVENAPPVRNGCGVSEEPCRARRGDIVHEGVL